MLSDDSSDDDIDEFEHPVNDPNHVCSTENLKHVRDTIDIIKEISSYNVPDNVKTDLLNSRINDNFNWNFDCWKENDERAVKNMISVIYNNIRFEPVQRFFIKFLQHIKHPDDLHRRFSNILRMSPSKRFPFEKSVPFLELLLYFQSQLKHNPDFWTFYSYNNFNKNVGAFGEVIFIDQIPLFGEVRDVLKEDILRKYAIARRQWSPMIPKQVIKGMVLESIVNDVCSIDTRDRPMPLTIIALASLLGMEHKGKVPPYFSKDDYCRFINNVIVRLLVGADVSINEAEGTESPMKRSRIE